METLAKAHVCIERGAGLLATNPDNWCPISDGRTRPGAGATAAFLEASTGRRAYYLGKPNGYMFHCARRRLAEVAGGSAPEQIVVIGDTMETDIRGAIEAGMLAYLVLTGSTAVDHLPDHVFQPTRVLKSVADLIEEVESGKPSSRIDSPAFTRAPAASRRFAGRYGTYAGQPGRLLPRAPMTR